MLREWRQIVLLGRTFFGRLFESDLMPAGLPQVQLVIGSILLLATPLMLVPLGRAGRYAYLWFVPSSLGQALAIDRVNLITLAMIGMGFAGLVIWEGVFPDRRDVRILSALPLRTTTFVVARLGAIATLFCLLAAGAFAPPTVLFGAIARSYGSPAGLLHGIVAQFIAMAMAAATGFFTIIALQCALLSLLGRAFVERLSVVLQIVCAIALMQLLFFLPYVGGGMRDGNLAPDWLSSPQAALLPSVWFLGVEEALSGFGGRGTYALALRAVVLTSCAVAGSLLLYAACYRRLIVLALETPAGARSRSIAPALGAAIGAIARRLPGAVRGSPIERAVCTFTIRTLVRSRQHRMLLALYAAVALAIAAGALLPLVLRRDAAGVFAQPGVAVFSAPLVIMFLVLVGMRGLFAIPVERKANWVVRLVEPADRRAAIDGVRRAMLASCVIPVVLLATATTIPLWGVSTALKHGFFCAMLGAGLTELLLAGLVKIPFTCTYFPGKARLRTLWPLYLSAFMTYAYTMAAFDAFVFVRSPRAFLIASIVFCTAIAALSWWRGRALADVPGLLFEEEDPDAVIASMNLSEGLAARGHLAAGAGRLASGLGLRASGGS